MSNFQVTLLSCFADIIPFVVGLYVIRTINKPLRLLLLFFSLTISIDVIVICNSYYKVPNIWFYTIFTQLEYAFLTLLFSKWLTGNLSKVLKLSIVVFQISYLSLIYLGMGIRELYFFYSAFEHFLLLTYSAYTLYYLTGDKYNLSLYDDSRFWISAGVLIYFSGSFLLYAIAYFKPVNNIWLIQAALNIIANIFYTGGFLSRTRLRIIGFWALVPRSSLCLLLLLFPVWYAIIAV